MKDAYIDSLKAKFLVIKKENPAILKAGCSSLPSPPEIPSSFDSLLSTVD